MAFEAGSAQLALMDVGVARCARGVGGGKDQRRVAGAAFNGRMLPGKWKTGRCMTERRVGAHSPGIGGMACFTAQRQRAVRRLLC